MTEPPVADPLGEVVGSFVCLLVVAAIDSDMRHAREAERERAAIPTPPLRRRVGSALRRLSLKPLTRLAS